jgi:hypothetical protein
VRRQGQQRLRCVIACFIATLFVGSALAVQGTLARADHIVLNYQPSQKTGYPKPFTDTLGGHTKTKQFTDGTKGSRNYTISLDPVDPVYEATPVNKNIDYKNILNKAFGKSYEFVYKNGLTGKDEFNVQSYSVFASNGKEVGEDIYVIYNPSKGDVNDPPIDKKLHWIQVIWDNWSATQGVGKVENIVDAGKSNPFFDSPPGTAGITKVNDKVIFNFYDQPQGPSPDLAAYNFKTPIQWMAEDFLVYDTGKKNNDKKEIIDMFGGIFYGWEVTAASPEPSSLVLAGSGVSFVAVLWCRRKRYAPRTCAA